MLDLFMRVPPPLICQNHEAGVGSTAPPSKESPTINFTIDDHPSAPLSTRKPHSRITNDLCFQRRICRHTVGGFTCSPLCPQYVVGPSIIVFCLCLSCHTSRSLDELDAFEVPTSICACFTKAHSSELQRPLSFLLSPILDSTVPRTYSITEQR